jgi:transcriptional activator SPT7
MFENGVPSVSDLEMYIKDDIVRQGVRLQDMDKKLNSALQELVSVVHPCCLLSAHILQQIQNETVDDDVVFGDNADDDNFSS